MPCNSPSDRSMARTATHQRRRRKTAAAGGSRNASRLSPEKIQQVLTLISQDRRGEAELLFADLMRLPLHPPLLVNQLGVLAHLLGKSDVALDLLRRSTALEPSAPLLNNLGLVREQLGDYAGAQNTYEQALRADAGFAEAHYNLGNVLQKQHHYQESIAAYRQAIRLRPKYPEAYNNMACAQLDLGCPEQAEHSCLEAVRYNPAFAEAITTWGRIMEQQGDPGLLLASGGRIAELARDKVAVFASLAGILSALGRMEKASEYYQQALGLAPNDCKIHYLRAMVTRYRDPADLAEMEEAHARNVCSADRYFLDFALGKAYDDLSRYPTAFRFIKAGNDLLRSSYAYSLQADRNFISRLRSAFPADFIARSRPHGLRDATPIFVVGMPRSGTTMVEQILASHPEVYGAGELPDIDLVFRETLRNQGLSSYPDDIGRLPPEQFRAMGEAYIARLRRLSTKTRIVDKLPHNFLFLGLIQIILPEAKIIHCRRNPMDTCWSLYKNVFDTPHLYAQDLEELGRYYILYQDLMRHWQEVLPEGVYEIEYEGLIGDQKKETSKLLEYCNLQWDEACLDFHRARGKVITLSRSQVRQPLYKSSVRKWRCYEKELEPLRLILGAPAA